MAKVLTSACAIAVVLATGFTAAGRALARTPATGVRTLTIHYEAHDGADRLAFVVLPAWYGRGDHPPLPLVISPHGRGATGLANAKLWGDLPAMGSFAVVSPDGMGRKLALYSYGYPGQIDDLARMPAIVSRVLPWLRIDRRRIFAVGSSMGGQETLLLVARRPRLLAGAVAMDSVTDLVRRWAELPSVPCSRRCLARVGGYGRNLRALMRREIGGAPSDDRAGYEERSPLAHARAIASSGVPLQVWWSTDDRVVVDQRDQSEAFVQRIRQLDPDAPVTVYRGTWSHSHEMRASGLLIVALKQFHLIRADVPVSRRSLSTLSSVTPPL